MDILLYLVAAVVFFALIMASVALHEVGHMLPAKLFNVKVTEYFVGFGRTLRSWKRGETEYGFKAFPLGGYVRLVGMYPPARGTDKVKATAMGPFQQLSENARSYEWETISPADDGRLFYQKKMWQKLIIMFGGPLMNLLLAFVIFWGVIGIHGVYRPQLTIAAVSECVVPVDRTEQTCQPGDPPTPAVEAGVQPGDRIVSFNGVQVRDWDHFSELIRANMDRSATVAVEREGRTLTLPTVQTVRTGVPDAWDPGKRVDAGFFGVTPDRVKERGGPVAVAKDMWKMTLQSGYALVRFPVKVWYVGVDLVTGRDRDMYGPISIVGASRAAGEVATTDQITAADKVATVFSLLASVNLFVALFNLVPLPPLDGGHIVGALWEGLRRWWAKVRGKPDPGPVDTTRMLPIAYLVGGFVLLCGVVLIIADVLDPIRLFG
ncbi:M50 family metallopeptidase [Enemella sp. A6]|uniref:M50 family metallopeptidase n=1 Tax=Enemella sp. A6 TaxID=3440152 RepID=UPI003EBDD8EB